MKADRFRAITRWGDFSQVMAGIEAAERVGLKIKLNAVALKGVNEDEYDDLIRFAHGRGIDLTLIETMPMGEIDGDRTDQYLPLSIVRARLMDRWTLQDIPYRSERQLVESAAAQMARQGAKQPQDVLAHQWLAAGDPELADAFGDESRAQPVELFQRQQVLLGQEGHVLRHAVDAAEVAADGDGNPEIGHVSAEGVDHRPDRGAGDELNRHDLCNSRLRDTA